MVDQVKVVVVGVDGSDHSLKALRTAIDEAAMRDAELHVVHVVDFTPAILHLAGDVTIDTADVAAAHRQQVWETVAELLSTAENVKRVDLEGYPADSLVDYCTEVGADLLVLGTRGRGRLATIFLGSTSLRALERAHCNVLIAKT